MSHCGEVPCTSGGRCTCDCHDCWVAGRVEAAAAFACAKAEVPAVLELRRELNASGTRLSDARVLALYLAKWIADHPSTMPDHACAQCVPGGDITIPGFVCGQHVAQALLLAATATPLYPKPCDCTDMTDAELTSELARLNRKFDTFRRSREGEGSGGGSPGEWMTERMSELETEQERRKSGS